MVSYLQIGGAADLRTIALGAAPMSLGRLERNHVCLPDDSVSRVHAQIEFRFGSWWLRDLCSRNGTWVNGTRVLDETLLADGDEIRLGTARLTFHAQTALADAFAAGLGPDLTRREQEVLQALAADLDDPLADPISTLAIAMALFVTEAAVKQHLLNLYRKFDVPASAPQRRRRLVEEAARRGVLATV